MQLPIIMYSKTIVRSKWDKKKTANDFFTNNEISLVKFESKLLKFTSWLEMYFFQCLFHDWKHLWKVFVGRAFWYSIVVLSILKMVSKCFYFLKKPKVTWYVNRRVRSTFYFFSITNLQIIIEVCRCDKERSNNDYDFEVWF